MTSVSWIPTPAGVTSLPPAPAVVDNTPSRWRGFVADVGADPQATLTAAAPTPLAGDGVQETSSWDIWKYDGSVWVNLGPDVGPTLTVTSLIPMFDQVLPAVASTRTRLVATSIPYALELLTEVAVKTRSTLDVVSAKAAVPATALWTLEAAVPVIRTGASVKPEATAVSVAAAAPAVSSGVAVAPPVIDFGVDAIAPADVGTMLVMQPPATELGIAAPVAELAAGKALDVPAAGVTIAAASPSVQTRVVIAEYSDFSSTSGLSLVSTYGVVGNALYLTDLTSGDVGNAWLGSTSTYNRDFSVEWVFEIGGGGGADGFCLQWYTLNNINGGSGGDAGRVSNSSVANAFTFNTFGTDVVKWHKNNAQQSSQNCALAGATWRTTVYYWLDYDHALSQAKLYYSTTSTKPGSPQHTYSSFSFGATSYYLGFGAGTGGVNDNHILKSFGVYA